MNDRKKYELRFSGDTWEVQRKSSFSESDDYAHVGFARVRDLTKLDEGTSWWPRLQRLTTGADPAFLMFLMIALLFTCVALPGIGDKLGTATKVRAGVHTIMDAFKEIVR